MIPGTGRGSGQYVYRLGERGKKFYPGKYRAARLPDMEHMIATVEAFITVQQLEQAGAHKVIAMYPEPDTWTVIEDIELRPDLYVELQDVATGQTGVWWIEIDMNNEGRADITKKVQDYIKAKDLSGEYEETDPQGHVTRIQVGPETFPLVLFLVPEQQRQTFIQRIVDQHHDKAGAKFEVEIFSKFQEWVLQSIAV